MKNVIMFLAAMIATGFPASLFYQTEKLSVKEIVDGDVQRIEIKNVRDYFRKSSGSDKMKFDEIIDEYELDLDELQQTETIVIQNQTFKLSEGIQTIDEISEISLYDSTKEDAWTDGKWLRITTYCAKVGTTISGNPIWKIESQANILKKFFMRKQDQFIIRHSDNATYCDEYFVTGYLKRAGQIMEWKPSFTNSFGLSWEFLLGQDAFYPEYIKGYYYIILTNDAAVQASYVHCEALFSNSVSVSIGPVGFDLGVDGGNTTWNIEPVTLYYAA